jgi:hypothetical protein
MRTFSSSIDVGMFKLSLWAKEADREFWSIREGSAQRSMDPKLIQGKVQAFAQRLLDEANGDPVRALGLLVLVLDGADLESADHAQRLVVEVRKVLMPESIAEIGKPVQHLVGDVSWEGVQHCLRCAKVLARSCHERGTALATGYVYEIGPRFTSEECDDFETCI